MKSNTVPLSQLGNGDSATIAGIHADGPEKRRMLDMGLVPGVTITMVRKAPLGDPIEFRVRGYSLSLRKRECELINVEVTG